MDKDKKEFRKKREMFTYKESEVKEICIKLLNSFTNHDEVKDYKENFDDWFKQNKK